MNPIVQDCRVWNIGKSSRFYPRAETVNLITLYILCLVPCKLSLMSVLLKTNYELFLNERLGNCIFLARVELQKSGHINQNFVPSMAEAEESILILRHQAVIRMINDWAGENSRQNVSDDITDWDSSGSQIGLLLTPVCRAQRHKLR